MVNKFLDWSADKPLFWVMVVGVFGGLLNLSDPKKSIAHNIANAITGILSSVFMCWIAYECALYFTQADRLSLAIGGFFAWRGANWANEIVDRFINDKINTKNFEYDEGDEISPRVRNLDLDK
ncbi:MULTISPECIES: phage holin family protein, partial [unclassified Campylobacter]|uniref:phage holin family protein n=1 Tax=unclassified Campylobacter TaxID=2593542 RepID=UPI003D33183D